MQFTPAVAVMLLTSAAAQIVAAALIPLSQGYTRPLPTIGSLLAFGIGMTLVARISHAGVNIGTLIPIMSATIPLCAIAVGVMFYGEPASFARIGILVLACILVGVSNLV